MSGTQGPAESARPAGTTREALLSRTFVEMADTMTSDFDVVELLQTLVDRCTEVLDASAAGLMLVDPQGQLQVVASTSEDADLVELVQISAQDGPCYECFRTGRAVTVADIPAVADRWPGFAAAAAAHGFASVHATPMRLRDEVIGTINLLDGRARALNDADIAVAQALTDVATIGILQARLVQESQALSAQLQAALSSRVVIEQAKGVLSALADLSMDESFRVLRAYARRTSTPLREVAARVVDRSLDVLADGR